MDTVTTEGPSEDIFRMAAEQINQEYAARGQTPQAEQPSSETPPEEIPEAEPKAPAPKSLLQRGVDMWKSAGAGIAKAGFETKDFLFGEPAEEDKSDLRRGIEQRGRELASESTANALTMSISQMATGLIGAGKLMAPIKAAKWMAEGGKVAKAGYEIAKASAASAAVLDPHEERLSNLVESFPALQNPVTEYLAAKPDDSAAEGRFKNALESIGVDLALVGVVKTIKLMRSGDIAGAKRTIAKLSAAKRNPEIEAAAFEANKDAPGFRNLYAERHAERKASAAQTATEARTESPASEGTTTPANTETATSEAPRVDERHAEFEERAATLEYDAGLSRAEAERQAADELGYHPAQDAETSPKDSPEVSAPGMAITDDDISAILKSTGDDLAAIKKYGTREAAFEAGQIIRRGPSTLPWQKLRSSEEVSAFMENAARVLKTQMDDAKGGAVMSDAKVNAMVEARAEIFGEDPALVLGQIREAGDAAKGMVTNMESGYLIGSRMMEDTYAIAFRMENGMEADAAKAGEELKARLMASAEAMAHAQSISSNSGRALRRMRGQFRFTPELLEKVKTMDGAALARLIYQTKGDPKLLAQMINPNFLQTAIRKASDSLTNSLLWLYPTHVVNMTSNLYMLAARPTEKLIGSLAVQGAERSIIQQRALKEYRYTLASLSDGWDAMLGALKRGDSILSPHNTEYFGAGSIAHPQQPQWKPINGLWDIVHNGLTAGGLALRLPTRLLGGVDELVKTLRYRAYVQADAAVKGEASGLTGANLQSFISRKMEEAIDPITGQALNRKALDEAQVTTFQQELLAGTAGATAQMVRSKHPLLTFVLPFVKTPINVLRYSWRMTPGLNLLQQEFREALSGKSGAEAQAQAAGQMALGSVFMGLAATLALNGKMTGAGPNKPDLQKELKATGWQPYSYVMEDEQGGKRFIPMGRFDPTGMVMSMMADLVEISRQNPEGKDAEMGIGALALALGKNFTDRTFLLNLNQALQAFSDPGNKGEKWLGNLAGNAIPFSSAIRGLNPDPYLREARGFIDTMLKNLPGYSETLPPVRDSFGEPVWKKISITTTQKPDIVETEHNRIMLETGKTIGKPDPALGGEDLRGITLSDGRNAYDRLQELSGQLPKRPSLKSLLEKTIKADWYQRLPDGDADVTGTRLNALSRQAKAYRKAAKALLLAENPELREVVFKRQRDAYAAQKRKQAEEPSARALLEALTPQAN
jgi:hypothetical protein